MNQFNIFLDFYRIIAEMTEEEIVSAIGSPKYRNSRKRTTHLPGAGRESCKRREEETAFRHILRQLSGWPFQCDPCQISGIYRDRYRPFE